MARDRLQAFREGLSEPERRVLETEQRAASGLLDAHDRPERILEAAADALSYGEDFRRHHLQVVQPAEPIACHDGCHWCCHLSVAASAPEIFRLAQYIRENTDPATLASIRARATKLAQDPRIFSPDAKAEAKIPCPVLTSEGSCAAYAARPLACRGWNASDPEACRRALDDETQFIPMNMQLARDCAVVSVGLLGALESAGLPIDVIELTAGLSIALNEPNALERWLAGEAIFASALAERPSDG